MGVVIGVVREIKSGEWRVALTPDAVRRLVDAGHEVDVETCAGEGARFTDAMYEEAGADIVGVRGAWNADLVCKMKEVQPGESRYLTDNVLFSALHLAVEPALARALCQAGTTAIALESVTDGNGRYPILAPMSEIAGRLAVQVGAHELQGWGGRLMAPVAGAGPARVLVIGAGSVGRAAAEVAEGMGAAVLVFDKDASRMNGLTASYRFSDPDELSEWVPTTALLIGACAVNGARAPVVVTREMVRTMRPGSVIVDVAIDQGGCVETSVPTTWVEPVAIVEGIKHVGISNLPGAAPVTASLALSAVTLPYVLAIASSLEIDGTLETALELFPGLRDGLAIAGGEIVHEGVRAALGVGT